MSVQLYPNQQEIVNTIISEADNTEVYAIDAPTGSGKTLISLFSAKGLGSGNITTPLRTLSRQYAHELETKFSNDDLGKMVMGRGAYPCPYLQTKEKPIPDATADGAPCIDSKAHYQWEGKNLKECPFKKTTCPYYSAVREAKKSQTVVSTFHYYMHGINPKISEVEGDPSDDREWSRKDALIIDEAHNLPAIFSDFFKVEASKKSLPDFDYDTLYNTVMQQKLDSNTALKLFQEMFTAYLDMHVQTLQQMLYTWEQFWIDMNPGNLKDEYGNYVDDRVYEKRIIKQRKLVYRLNFIKTQMEREDVEWIFYTDQDGMYWKPYSPAPFLEDIWSKFQHIIFMSATLFNVPLYIKLLGLDSRKSKFLKMDSTFDPSKGKIFFPGKLWLKKDNFDETIDGVIKLIQDIADRYSTESGIIHAFSRKYKEAIYERAPPDLKRRLITHTSNDRTQMLDEFMDSPKGTIFLTMNMGEGLDLKDDLSRWQIIVKAPFMPIGDPWIKAHMDREKGWYDSQTITQILQMCGRIVRSKDDWGDTYIIDQNAYAVLKRNWSLLPKWFTDRIRAGQESELSILDL
ncbi:MAG: helicase C-terminal domain-containing protein [Thermoplasmataceae archaeon]